MRRMIDQCDQTDWVKHGGQVDQTINIFAAPNVSRIKSNFLRC